MNAQAQLRIVTRYGVWFAAAGVAILLLAGFLVSNYQDRLFRAQRLREVTVQSQILAASVTAPVAFDDVETAREYVDALRVNPDIEAIGVYDSKNTLFAGFSRDPDHPAPRVLRRGPTGIAGGRVTVSVPIRQGTLALAHAVTGGERR